MEIWKDIKNYEGLYQVSSKGRVKALARTVINKNGLEQNYPERYLKFDVTSHNNSDYLRVALSQNHKVKKHSVHRLVAEAFIPNIDNKPHVNHLDNDATNNNVSNLEWVTHSENMIHAQKQNRLFTSQSKGGKTAGELKLIELQQLADSLINSSFNAWTITNNTLVLRAKKYYVWCTCMCGKQQLIDFSRLRRLEVTACKKCSFSGKYKR